MTSAVSNPLKVELRDLSQKLEQELIEYQKSRTNPSVFRKIQYWIFPEDKRLAGLKTVIAQGTQTAVSREVHFKSSDDKALAAIGSHDLWGVCTKMANMMAAEQEKNRKVSQQYERRMGDLGAIFSKYYTAFCSLERAFATYHNNKSATGQARAEIRSLYDGTVGFFKRVFS